MTKTELEASIEGFKNLVLQKNEELTRYGEQINALSKELKDLNKPKLTGEQFDELHGAIEEAVGQFDFDDSDNYSFDFHIDYDNRVAIESLTFDNADEIVREVFNQISELFTEISEDNNQENQD